MFALFPSRAVALQLGPLVVHWYGLLYLAGFLGGYVLFKKLQASRGLAIGNDDLGSLLTWTVAGVLIGGRLGYVLLYEPAYFLAHPLDIFAVWNGGMASHGGFIGVAVALYIAVSKADLPKLAFADVLVVPVALGLALGRIGNLINYELYGTVTSVPWAMAIPGVEGLRHPAPVYAVMKNLFIAGVCCWHLRFVKPVVPGRTCALFLMLYGVLRFLVEYFREQEHGFIDVGVVLLSRGQLYTIPVFITGCVLWWMLRPSRKQ